MTTIGVLHPGEMGAGIAGALVRAGHEVLWSSQGRGPESTARAQAAGLKDAHDLAGLVEACEVILSICPPHAALEVAKEVAGFHGTYVDANAIAPEHAAAVGAIVGSAGATFVDGGIIGSPPPGDRTRLYLSGEGAEAVAALFLTDEVATHVLSGAPCAASAMKMAYAAWTKGTAALMLDIRAMARATGVEADLVAEWSETSPELLATSRRAARQAEDRGWRWVGEMAEIAHTFRSVGLPGGFHDAAEEIFRRSPRKADAQVDDATLSEVVDALLAGG